jgi:holo-[acyl-carrier protein] synthase
MGIGGIGIDVCDVERMARELAREGGGFRDAVFTPVEVARCEAGVRPERRFAACFAAKEAVFKALAKSGAAAPAWQEIEIVAGARGETTVLLHGATARLAAASGICAVTVSLATAPGVAVAFAVASSGG